MRVEYEFTTTTQDLGTSNADAVFDMITTSLAESTAPIEGGGVTPMEALLRVNSVNVAQATGTNVTAAIAIFSDVTSTGADVPTTFATVILKTGTPTSMPTSQPSCGTGMIGDGGVNCGECPAGTYRSISHVHAERGCVPCDLDTYTDTPGSDECMMCQAPTATLDVGASSCDAFSLRGNVQSVVAVFVVIAIGFVVSVYAARNDRLAYVLMSLLPAMDFISDVIYVTQVRFYNENVFYCGIICLFFSSSVFVKELVDEGAWPRVFFAFPGSFIFDRVMWLSHDSFSPMVEDRIFDFEQHENLPKVLAFMVLWPTFLILQFVWVVVYGLWLALHCFVWGPLLVVGLLLFLLKGMCVKRVYVTWLYAWCGNEKCTEISEELGKTEMEKFPVDAGMMNEAILSEVMLESIPQLLLQGLNNSATGQWTDGVSLFSFMFSLALISNSLYRFGYLSLCQGSSIKDVPFKFFLPVYMYKCLTCWCCRTDEEEGGDDKSKTMHASESCFNRWFQKVELKRPVLREGEDRYRRQNMIPGSA